jgi:hypothetical protein
MTYANQKTTRDALVTELKTITTLADETHASGAVDGDGHPILVVDLEHVVGYFTKNPKGISPFACVDSMGALYGPNSDPTGGTPFRFVVGFWALRDATDGADDELDDLALALAKKLQKFLGKFITWPVVDYETIDGAEYKYALHFVEISR